MENIIDKLQHKIKDQIISSRKHLTENIRSRGNPKGKFKKVQNEEENEEKKPEKTNKWV